MRKNYFLRRSLQTSVYRLRCSWIPRLEELEPRTLLSLAWQSTNPGLFGYDFGACVTPNGYFFASDGFDIHRSVDHGSTWQTVTGFGTFAGGPIAYAPSNPASMIAGGGRGLLKSVDGGSNWFQLSGLSAGIPQAITFQPDNELTVYTGSPYGQGLDKSTNGGATFTNLLPSRDVFAIAIDPSNPQVVYVGSHSYSSYPSGVMKSTNGGGSWISILSNTDVSTIVVDPVNPQQIYAGAADGGVYKSANAGGTWTKISGS